MTKNERIAALEAQIAAQSGKIELLLQEINGLRIRVGALELKSPPWKPTIGPGLAQNSSAIPKHGNLFEVTC